MSEIATHTLPVEFKEYDQSAMFMRMVRADGETENGRKVEVATNELGAGIIVQVGNRKFVVSEFSLVDAILVLIDGG